MTPNQTNPGLKIRIIGAVILFASAFAAGRYTTPERIEIRKETVTVEVEKKQTTKDQKIEQNKKKTEVEITRPDGTKIKKTVTETDKKKDTQIEQTVEREKDTKETETKIVENPRRLTISVIGGPNFTDLKSPLAFGGHISRPFLGPITLGVWGLNSGVGGLSLGLQF